MNYKIQNYLKDKFKDTGTCKFCGKKAIPWSRARVTSHMSKSCTEISESEKKFFESQKRLKDVTAASTNVANSMLSSMFKSGASVDPETLDIREAKRRRQDATPLDSY